jgi:hypothetical protein
MRGRPRHTYVVRHVRLPWLVLDHGMVISIHRTQAEAMRALVWLEWVPYQEQNGSVGREWRKLPGPRFAPLRSGEKCYAVLLPSIGHPAKPAEAHDHHRPCGGFGDV